MTIVYTITAIIASIALIALLLPRKFVVTRHADVAIRPEAVIARVALLRRAELPFAELYYSV